MATLCSEGLGDVIFNKYVPISNLRVLLLRKKGTEETVNFCPAIYCLEAESTLRWL